MTEYLNRDDVRSAIHVKSTAELEVMYGQGNAVWGSCGMKNVEYTTRDADGRSVTPTLLPRYPALAAAYRILIFSGDADACVPVRRPAISHESCNYAPVLLSSSTHRRSWVFSVHWF